MSAARLQSWQLQQSAGTTNSESAGWKFEYVWQDSTRYVQDMCKWLPCRAVSVWLNKQFGRKNPCSRAEGTFLRRVWYCFQSAFLSEAPFASVNLFQHSTAPLLKKLFLMFEIHSGHQSIYRKVARWNLQPQGAGIPVAKRGVSKQWFKLGKGKIHFSSHL